MEYKPKSTTRIRWVLEERGRLLANAKIGIWYVAPPLVLGFHLVDRFFSPENVATLLKVRLCIFPALLITFLLQKIKYLQKTYWEFGPLFFFGFMGIYSAALIAITGSGASAYYAGLNLVSLGVFFFIPWSRVGLYTAVSLILLPYLAVVVPSLERSNLNTTVPNIAFVISNILMGVIANINFRKARYRDFLTRMALRNTLLTQDKIIEIKTNEAIGHSKLSRQFSPQVVEAILSGEISIDKITRREVSIFFLDIKSSSERASRIDHAAFSEVIMDLGSNVNKILLKHGLTVGTFLGDGVMSFCNAPQANPDHLICTLNAALDVLSFCDKKRDYYSEIWRKRFSVRLAVNVGYCNIGFFPSHELGTYTIIGDPVNQTARFCSLAQLDTICVPKTVLKKAPQMLNELEFVESEKNIEIKGFEGELFSLFHIKGKSKTLKETGLKNDNICPLCGRPLTIESNLGNVIMLKCAPPCKYMDIISAAG